MHIVQLFLERLRLVNIEIVVALLPEVRRVCDEPARDTLLQRLDGNGQRFAARLAEQQMYVVGHDHVSIDAEQVVAADSFQRGFEDSARCGIREMQAAMPAGKRDEMRLP